MTSEEKRIRIAEFLEQGKCRMCGIYHWQPGTGIDYQCNYLPDYLGDRDAIGEVLQKLPENRRLEFGEWLLTRMLHNDMIEDYPVPLATRDSKSEICGSLDLIYLIVQAPAWLLAEAFAETMALWEETPRP